MSLSQLASSVPSEPDPQLEEELIRTRAALASNIEEAGHLRMTIKAMEESIMNSTSSFREELSQLNFKLVAAESAREQCLVSLKTKSEEAALVARQYGELQLEIEFRSEGWSRKLSLLESEVSRLHHEVERMDQQITLKDEELCSYSGKLKDSISLVEHQKNELSDLQCRLFTLESSNKSFVEDIHRKQEELDEAQSRLEELDKYKSDLGIQTENVRLLEIQLAKFREESSAQLIALTGEVATAKADKTFLESELMQLNSHCAQQSASIHHLEERRSCLEQREYSLLEDIQRCAIELKDVREDCSKQILNIEKIAAGKLASLTVSLREAQDGRIAAESDLARLSQELSSIHSENQALKLVNTNILDNTMNTNKVEMDSLTKELEDCKASLQRKQRDENSDLHQALERVRALEKELVLAEQNSRILRNQIAELKGNVRVFARMRPFSSTDQSPAVAGKESLIMVNSIQGSIKISSQNEKIEDQYFSFDKAFGPDASQDVVFSEVSDYIQSALDGYNGMFPFNLLFIFHLHSLLIQLRTDWKRKDAYHDRVW